MSGLPIASTLSSNTIPNRDPSGPVTPPAASGVTAVIKTITEQAVQQTRQAEMDGIDTRRALASIMKKRAHLVGPPPAFELNVLQHLRETRGEPEEARAPGVMSDATEADGTAERVEPTSVSIKGYDALAEAGAPDYQILIDKHL